MLSQCWSRFAACAIFAFTAASGLCPTVLYAGTASIGWTAPTHDTGGAALVGDKALTEFRLYERCGSTPHTSVQLPPTQTQVLRENLPDGMTCYWQVSAVNAQGESARSAEGSKSFGPPTGTPTNLQLYWGEFKMPSATLLTSNSSVSPAGSHSTASISPTADRLILAVVSGVDNDLTTAPTIDLAGNGLTWVSIGRRTTGFLSLQVFRAMGASPSSGAVTIDADVASMGYVHWDIVEFSDVDTSGTNGSGAVRNIAENGASGTNTLSVTLPAFGSASNATFGAFVGVKSTGPATFSWTPGSGFTELSDDAVSAFGGAVYFGLQSEWKSTNDTSVDATASTTLDDLMGFALEIVAPSTGVSIPIAYNHYAKMMQAN